MSSGGSILAGFVKGFAGSAGSQMDERRKAEQQMARDKMLAQLQIDTEKEMTLFKESRPGYQLDLESKKVNIEGDRQKIRQNDELFPVELETKRFGLQAAREDQELQRKRFALDSAATAENIRASRAGGRGRSGDDDDDSNTSVTSRYKAVLGMMKDGGAGPYELARAESQWQDAQRKKKGAKWKSDYVAGLANAWSRKAAAHAALPALDSKGK